MKNTIDVYYFEKPTIGYCNECERAAIWNDTKGLFCPACGTINISIFEYNGEGPPPE
jgi:Zn finger protein HypA/HybF involved in hydrogenase expression